MAKPPLHTRGARSDLPNRYAARHVERDEPVQAPATTVTTERARSIITRNHSPDVPFDQSLNPYRGCEHGCIYCFARPSHAYLDLSPGLEFETRLYAKANAAELLERELARPGYRCQPLVLGTNTDPYQPIERRHRITRQLLEVLWRHRHPVSLITKGNLILEDQELLARMAAENLVSVTVSLTSLDPTLKRSLEPRAASPAARLQVIEQLTAAGIPVGVLIAPVIPAVTDHELEALLQAAAGAGASSAGYVLLRLPREVAPLFREWLQTHLPLRAERVMSLLRQARGGQDYDSRYGHRMRGQGPYAELLAQRFRAACRRSGLDHRERTPLDCSRFRRAHPQGQLSLAL